MLGIVHPLGMVGIPTLVYIHLYHPGYTYHTTTLLHAATVVYSAYGGQRGCSGLSLGETRGWEASKPLRDLKSVMDDGRVCAELLRLSS